jgi:hypothetical protein
MGPIWGFSPSDILSIFVIWAMLCILPFPLALSPFNEGFGFLLKRSRLHEVAGIAIAFLPHP